MFLKISLKFHLLANLIFLNIPFEVIFKLFALTLGIFSLKVSAGESFSSLLHVKYVTTDISNITNAATAKLLGTTTAWPLGIWKYSISIPINKFPINAGPAINPAIAPAKDTQNPYPT